MNWTAQFFGISAMICLFSAYQQNSRRTLILCKLGADISWMIHYFLLGAYGGMIPNFVGIFRELVFIQREQKDWAGKPWIPVIFIAVNWCIGFSSFAAPINILPIAASTFVTISLWLQKPALTKIISIPISLTFLIYDCFAGSYIGIINESFAVLSILINYIKMKK